MWRRNEGRGRKRETEERLCEGTMPWRGREKKKSEHRERPEDLYYPLVSDACARIHLRVYTRSGCLRKKIRKEVHSVEEKKSRRPHRRRLARVYPLPPHSIGRLIFYSGRSRICIRSGALFPFTFLSLCLSLPFSFSLWPLSSLRIYAFVAET